MTHFDQLLHSLANRMQAATASAALLQLSGQIDRAEPLQKLIDELQAATQVVQAMRREYESVQRKKAAAGSRTSAAGG